MKKEVKAVVKKAATRAVAKGKAKKAKNKRGFIKIVAALVILVAVAIGVNFALGNPIGSAVQTFLDNQEQAPQQVVTAAEGEIRVHFIDVGQGDAILLQSDDNAVLIDGGINRRATTDSLVAYLRDVGVTRLDYVVSTHPHADHVGGLPTILREFEVGHVLMPDLMHTTNIFTQFLEAIDELDIPVTMPNRYDENFFQAGIIHMHMVNPGHGPYRAPRDLNDVSIIVRMVHGETSFIFTGDAEIPAEQRILESGVNISADVMLAGHHGSRTSSHPEFVAAINPSIAVISVGEDNSYGHPNQEVLDTFAERNMRVYRTDQLGSIVLVTDGTSISGPR